MDLDKIKTIIELMDKYNLSEFDIEAESIHLCIKRKGERENIQLPNTVGYTQFSPNVVQQTPTSNINYQEGKGVSNNSNNGENKDNSQINNLDYIKAPIVGTFYRAPNPGAKPFVKVGDRVEPDTVVCIIEAMKVMNEIKAEKSGVIKEVLVENGIPVEFGTPLFTIE